MIESLDALALTRGAEIPALHTALHTTARARRTAAARRDAEARLVFALAGPGSRRTAVGELGPAPRWQRLLGVATLESAVFALQELLRDVDPGVVPVEVQRYLAYLVLAREHHLRVLERRLEAALRVLNDAGIEPILLKGAALAVTVYGGVRARPMNDIDLLVEAGRAREARDLMVGAGWEPHPLLPEARYRSHHHLAPLRDRDTRSLRLEIHRALLPDGQPFRFTTEEIQAAAVPIRVGTAAARVLPPTEHAVHIAIHFVWSHMMQIGAWHAFRDLAALDGAGMLDWAAVVDTARRWGAASCCYWTLRLGRELAQLPVPEPVLQELAPQLSAPMGRRIERHFTQILLRADDACPSSRLQRAVWSAAVQPAAEGHSAVRPWSVSVDITPEADAAARPAGGLRAGWARAGHWRRYVTSLL